MNVDATTAARGPESVLWQGSPSQVINLPQYLSWGLVFIVLAAGASAFLESMDSPRSDAAIIASCLLASVPLWIIGWKWLVLRNLRYDLTTQRLRIRTGVLNKRLEEIELYRVRDYRLDQPFFLRLFSLSNVTLQTSDKSAPIVVLRAIPGGEAVREQLRAHVEEARMRRGVREIDLE